MDMFSLEQGQRRYWHTCYGCVGYFPHPCLKSASVQLIRHETSFQPHLSHWHSGSRTIRINSLSFTRYSCIEEVFYLVEFLQFLVMVVIPAFGRAILSRVWKRPIGNPCLTGAVTGTLLDLFRCKQQLVVENALL